MEQDTDRRPEGEAGRDLAALVVERIAREGVTPLPWWRFAVADAAFWGAWIAATALGGVAAAVTFHDVVSARWDLYEATHSNFWTFAIDAAPWVWLGSLALFVPIGVLAMRATRRGYRRKVPVALGLSALLSVAAGAVLYSAGVGRAIDAMLPSRGAIVVSARGVDAGIWLQPERGRIAGKVSGAAGDGFFTVESWDGGSWRVASSSVDPDDLRLLADGAEVRVLGLPTTTRGVIEACLVLPWDRPVADLRRGASTTGPLRLVAASEACRVMPWYEKFSGRVKGI